jgi:hypothetical protein
VDEKSGNSARARVDVLVIAPDGKVDIPIMEPYIYIPHRVSKVPPNDNPVQMSVSSDGIYIKVLTCIVLNPR